MSYQYDSDLEFLGQCKNEDLEVLFKFLSYNRDGQKRLNGKLLDSEEYKLYKEDYNKYWKRIAEEFQMYSSGVIPNIQNAVGIPFGFYLNQNEKPYLKYNEVLEQKLNDLKIYFEKFFPIELKEDLLFLYAVEKLFEKLSPTEKQNLLLKIGFEVVDLKEISIKSIFEKKIIADDLKFWKASKIIAQYISEKGLIYIFEKSYFVREIIFILIIAGLRRISKEENNIIKNKKETEGDIMAVRKNENNKENKIEIYYNPYLYKFEILDCSIKIDEEAGISKFIKSNEDKQLYTWMKQLIEEIKNTFGSKKFTIIFNGREDEFEDLKDECDILNNNGYNINIEKNRMIKENKQIIADLEKYVADLEENAPEELKKELKDKNIIENFREVLNLETHIGVMAIVSSGKSTLINAIIGEEILPTDVKACTAGIYKIKDVDNQPYFEVQAVATDINNNNEEIIQEWTKAESEVLNKINEKANELKKSKLDICLRGDIKGFSSDEMKLVLVDTPGVNNSQNRLHKEITFNYIKDTDDNPLIMYIMTLKSYESTDNDEILKEITEVMEKSGKQAEERFIFILNQVDEIDSQKMNLDENIEKFKEYLKEKGIKNPKIFPVSAEFAKLLRMEKKKMELTRSQKLSLRGFKDKFIPIPEEGYEGIDTIKYSSLTQKEKEELYKEAEEDKEKVYLHYSGITAIEKYIEKYIRKYSKIQKIHESIEKLQNLLNSEKKEIKLLKEADEEELNNLISQINKLQENLRKDGKNKIEEAINEIKKFSAKSVKNDEFNTLFSKIQETSNGVSKLLNSKKVTREDAKRKIEEANEKTENLLKELREKCRKRLEISSKKMVDKNIKLIKEYFEDLMSNIDLETNFKIVLDGYFKVEINNIEDLLEKGKIIIIEETGRKKVIGYDRGTWKNPWTWYKFFFPEAIEEIETEEHEYIDLTKISDEYIVKFLKTRETLKNIQEINKNNIKYIEKESSNSIYEIEKTINEKIKILKEKIEEQKDLTSEKTQKKEKLEDCIKELENIIDLKN